MTWSQDSTICTTLFMCLTDAGQIDVHYNFLQAGSLKMSQLQFFNNLASADIQRADALMLASKLDNELQNAYLATYNKGYNSSLAINAMLAIMVQPNDTVTQLADTINTIYTIS